MRRTFYSGFSLLIAVLAVFLLAAEPARAQQRQALQTHATAPVGAVTMGRLPASQQMQLAISLPLRNQEQLNTLLQQLEDPANPNYHHYLTSAQFNEQFGPTAEQYQQVIAFAQAHGFTVTHTSASRQLLNVTGSVANVEKTFQVKMQVYQHPTESRTYFAPSVAPTVDFSLPILSVSGLTDFVKPHSMLKHAPAAGVHSEQTGSGPGGAFLGSDFRTAYYGTGSATGSGQALALIEFGQWNMADVQAYFTSISQTNNVPIVLELTGGTSGACPGACDDGEEANDVIQIVAMAPGANALIVYEDTSNNADINMFDAYANDNVAKQTSMSFGIGNGNAAADEQEFQKMHAQGQNFFLASGDEGANLGDGGWPGYSQYVTDVGGTDLSTATPGGAWSSEIGWVGSGTGWCDPTIQSIGGVTPPQSSACYQATNDGIPSYQEQIVSTITAAGGSSKYRNLPDVSADANTDSWSCGTGSCGGGLGGTSLAAPRWAGFLALANEQAAANGETIGFLNPLVYTIGQGSGYDTAFHDITSGSNPSGSVPPCCTGSFTAMTGFDMVTGWGTPNGQGMINALAPISTTSAFFTLSASPSTLNLTPGGTAGTTTISLTPGNGFTGSVTLSANVIASPAGVTASFNPTSISGTGTSTLTVSTTSGTPAGTLMIAVTGTSPGGIETQPAFVTLALPDFSLSVAPATAFPDQPSSIYLNQSSTAAATVTVSPQNNFTGTVNLSASSLPKGVTGSFNPTSTKTSSTMTLTANSTATTGTDFATVSGTSGNISPLNAPYTIVSVSAATGTGGSGTPIDLSAEYNLPAIYEDGITFGSGMDGEGSGYSSNLLAANRILNGVQFNFGPASTKNCTTNCTNDAVSVAGQTITLPAGQQSAYTTFQILAAAVNGPITSQTITVNYTDGSSSTFTQNFSDWCSCSGSKPGPGQQSGESFAVVMPYRDGANGAEDNTAFNLYAYNFVLNSAKTVESFTLPAKPASGGVVVFAATFTAQSLGTQLNLLSVYNTAGLYNNGVTFPATGGMDGGGNNCTIGSGCADAYSAEQLDLTSTSAPTLTNNGILFNLGPVNTTDCTTGCIVDMVNLNPGVTVTLPGNQQAKYTTLTMLGTGVQGNHPGTVSVAYTSGSPSVFDQTFSDWCSQTLSQNESIVVGNMSRINSDGTLNTGAQCNLYSYTFTLDSTRTVQSIALANTDSTNFSLVLALSLSGNTTSSGPGFTLSPNPGSLSVAQGSNGTSTITVTPSGGFSGSVSLAASGLPSGVTAAFNPTSTTSPTNSSTLTLTASGTATIGGPTAVTITGTSGSLTQTTTVNLTVTGPASFTLSAPSSLSVAQGGNSAGTITVNPTGGFTGSVNLAVTSTLPSGVTAAFNPTSTATTSTLTFTATSTATAGGPTAVTVTGTSGSLTQTATLNLTVTSPSSFAVTAGTPNPATVSPGSSSQASVTVTPANGFTGNVTLSCSIAPVVSGSNAPTCSFGSTSPVSITNSSPVNATLTFTTVGSSATKLNLHITFYALFLPMPGLMLIGLGFGRRGFGSHGSLKRGSRKSRMLSLLALWIVTAGLIVVPACGGSGNKSGGGGGGNTGTPAGAYTITINTSGGTQTGNAPTVSVTVN
jgi:subtilase family serine protease